MARWMGLCWPILKFCWGYVGSSGLYVGVKFAHLELCWLTRLSPVACESYVWIVTGPCWTHRKAHLNRFGVMKKTWLKKRSPQWPARSQYDPIFSPKPCSCLGRALRKCPGRGLCWPILGLCWGYVGPSGVYVGAMFAHLGAMLGLCWPPGGDIGPMLFSWVHLHSQISLEKALPSGLRGSYLDSLSKICLFLSSPQWPASFTFRAFLFPPVACESQVPPLEGVGGRGSHPP